MEDLLSNVTRDFVGLGLPFVLDYAGDGPRFSLTVNCRDMHEIERALKLAKERGLEATPIGGGLALEGRARGDDRF